MPRIRYSNVHKSACVSWLLEGYGTSAVQRLFEDRFNITSPARSTMRQWREDYQSRGTHAHRGGNGRPQITEEKKNEIRALFNSNPRLSLRAAAQEVGVAHATIWNFLRKELKMFPYKLQMTTALTESHKERRLRFARDCRRELRNNAGYLRRIVFSDECKFSLSGSVNKQNCRIWGLERPKEVYETLHNSPSIMVWCALSESEIIGPYFFENENVTGSTYKRMLRYFLLPKLQGYPEDMIFQQDGAPPRTILLKLGNI